MRKRIPNPLWTWTGALLLALGLLSSAACKRDTGGQLPARGGEAIQAEREDIEGFGLVRAWADQRSDGLALTLEFSQPLVGTQDFDALIGFAEPVGEGSAWSLDDDGTTLRFPFVEANTAYTVTVSADLTAVDGSRLGHAVERRIETGDLEPSVGFASRGSVLPARESRGLPVVSINVPEVDVEFLRVRESELPRFFSQYQQRGSHSLWQFTEDWRDRKPLGRLAESVYLNRFILGGERNERALTYLPLQGIAELREPGLYFAVMKATGTFDSQFETAFFTVSDIGLHARAYGDSLFVHTASLYDGGALDSVQLQVLDGRGEPVFRGETDRHGNALLDYTLDAAHVLVARRGGDVSLLPFNQPALDLSEFAVAGRGQASFDVFAWSGRDLYRPGETLRISALLRDHDGAPVSVAAGQSQPLFVRLKQPNGRAFLDAQLEAGEQGYYGFEYAIPADARTGRWSVEFRTDPASNEAVQGMTLRIEEFLPERMRLDLDAAQPRLQPGQALSLQAEGAYLYGAPASGNRFSATLSVAVERQPVEGMPGWFFGDPLLDLPREPRDVIDTALDAEGRLRQDIELPEEVGSSSPVAAFVAGSLYESGGRTVNRTLKRVLWPADALVGVRPLFDHEEGADYNTRAGFELLRVDASAQPRPVAGLQVALVREHRDYHWTRNENGAWDYDFDSRFERVETRTLDVGETVARIDFPVEWGEYRLEVLDPSTGLTTRYPFRAGWSWGDGNRGVDARPDRVKLALDGTGYRAGDTLKVTVTPPQAGKGLLLVESDELLHVQAIEATPGATFEIPVTDAWERHDVYVTALVFRGGSATSKVTPARAVGVAHVPMRRAERRVAVGLAIPQQVRPEQPFQVGIGVPQLAGQRAHVVVSAVDVGILNITRFPVPDAFAHFFAQRRFGVDAYDIYGRVIESYEGGSGRLRFGGDMALATLPQARRPTARVQTVDLYSGPVALDARGNARIPLEVPDFNGTLRVSAVVYGDRAYGNRDAELLVRAPVVAEVSMPRVLAPGDRSTLTLDITNFTGRAGDFDVQVGGEGPLAVGEGRRRVALAADGRATLNFPLTAASDYATADVRVQVEGGGHRSDRRYDLPIRAAWPAVLRTRNQALDRQAVSLDRSLADGLMPGSVTAQLSVSALPPIPFASALRGALHYPYGCVEQTVSRGYAALILDPDNARRLGVGDVDSTLRNQYVAQSLGRLASLQANTGHYSMWAGGSYSDPALTPYVAEFLLEARDAGFAVPETLLQSTLERLNEDLLAGGNQFYGRDERQHLRFAYQAHAGYVLARVNRAPLGTLRALHDNDRGRSLSGLPLVHLGLALTLQGDAGRGQVAIDEGFAFRADRPRHLGDYGSRVRDRALMLALVAERDVVTPQQAASAIDIGREVDARRNASGVLYMSTQEQIALARLGRALVERDSARLSGILHIGDAGEAIDSTRAFGRSFVHSELARGVRFEPESVSPLYASIEVAGIPRNPPPADDSRLKVERRYYTLDGTPWTPGPLPEGEALLVAVAITADQRMRDALLTDLLPAGLEIENFNLTDSSQWANVEIEGVTLSDRHGAASVQHEEYRDDRFVAALDLAPGSTARVFYLVRAVTPGTYTVPPSLVEDMYRPELRGVGVSTPATITVVQPD